MRARSLLVVLAAAATTLASGCGAASGDADKAGGAGGGPVVLRMVSVPGSLEDLPAVADFAQWVSVLSGGSVRIGVVNHWGGDEPDAEVQVVGAVRSGKADLGWVGSRVFDAMGLPTFQALSAPMLIDSYPLENAVLRSAVPGQMLPSLTRIGVTGLAIYGDELRLAISVHRPLLTPADWRGVPVGTYRSRVQEDAIRALGAHPVEAIGAFRSHGLADGTIRAFEFDVRRYARQELAAQAPYVAANVVLWPQFDVLFANPGRLSSLTKQQRTWIEQAVQDAARNSVALASEEALYVDDVCAHGARLITATSAELTALRESFTAVYRRLDRDPETKAYMRQLDALKRSTPYIEPLHIPAGCAGKR